MERDSCCTGFAQLPGELASPDEGHEPLRCPQGYGSSAGTGAFEAYFPEVKLL